MGRARPGLGFLTQRPYAHRGLHGPGVPENSLAAFRAAIAAGYGIECDVRLSREGVPHVFHDRTLERMTGATGRFADLDSVAITGLRLLGTAQAPPSLTALLALCARTPLLIEIKSDRRPRDTARLCAAIAADLAGHTGPAAVMSFDPAVCRWFARHVPQVPRGMVVSRRDRRGMMGPATKALAMVSARPHFIACDVRDLSQPGDPAPGLPRLTWTVHRPRDHVRARRHGAQIIFEA